MSYPCPECETEMKKIQSKKNKKYYWICVDGKCNYITSDDSGRPVKRVGRVSAPGDVSCPECKGAMDLVVGGKYGDFYSCKDYPACSGLRDPGAPDCPSCSKPMRKRRGKKNEILFWGCSQYPACSATLDVKN